MNLLKSFVLATLMMLAAPVLAQTAALPAESAAAVPEVPELAPAPAGMGEPEKCKQGMGGKMSHGGMPCCGSMQGGSKMDCEKCASMGGKMHHGGGKSCCGGMGGMGGCGGMHGGGAGDTAALERRINELEKRLDLMQQLLQPPRKTR